MLSRVANQLYWMGRYLERADHLARYINVEYFSSLDSSDARQQAFALDSIIDMLGLTGVSASEQEEEEILTAAALDSQNPVSIISTVYACRENARGIRDSISIELWEQINSFYLFVSGYPVDIYKTKGLHDFTTNVMQYCSNSRGRIMHTLLHDERWLFILLGLYIERSVQIIRILISKNTDIEKFKEVKLADFIESQHWSIVLDCIEAKDMFRKGYTQLPEKDNTVDFLLCNPFFPKSVINNLTRLKKCLEKIEKSGFTDRESIVFKVGKIISPFEYLEMHEITDDLDEFLQGLLRDIYKINDSIAEEYFT